MITLPVTCRNAWILIGVTIGLISGMLFLSEEYHLLGAGLLLGLGLIAAIGGLFLGMFWFMDNVKCKCG